MQGTFIFKPLQAHLTQDKRAQKATPYCEIILGRSKVKGQVARNGGKNPQWVDVIIMRDEGADFCKIQIKDRNTFKPDSILGECQIDLRKIALKGKGTRWFDISYKDKTVGELCIEINFTPDHPYLENAKTAPFDYQKKLFSFGSEEFLQLIK